MNRGRGDQYWTLKVGYAGANVGARLYELRKKQGWTLEEVARRLCLINHPFTGDQVRGREHGRRRIDIDELFAFARVLETTPEELISQIPRKGFLRKQD